MLQLEEDDVWGEGRILQFIPASLADFGNRFRKGAIKK